MLPEILQKLNDNKRIDPQEALILAQEANLLELASLAQARARKINGDRVAYLIDRNVNYTNICEARCSFCAFYRPINHKQGYDLTFDQIDQKIEETLAFGGTRILMQGGLHPDHTVDDYVHLVAHIKKKFPQLLIHAFSPPEIHFVAEKAGLSYEEVLTQLKQAGLGSMPGGGAEILVDEIRDQIVVGKCNAQQWLDVMETAHGLGIRSTATMMMGHIESWQDRITHLDRLRDVQDRSQGFLSFIPWTFQPENTPLHPKIKRNANVKLASAYEYLRFLSLARLYLDNFDHIQVSLLTQGAKVAQMGLQFGADDLGSLLIEENVVRLAGKNQEHDLGKQKMVEIIEEAGLKAYERDTFYHEIQSDLSDQAKVLSCA